MKYNIEWLKNIANNGHSIDYIFFNSHKPNENGEIDKNCLSQFWNCDFVEDEIEYSSAEQYMMAKKAELFDDNILWQEILKTISPFEIKKLGRQIANFDERIWEINRSEIVIRANYLKFSQNREIKMFLIRTKGHILVEASKYDTIWGIGMNENNKDILNPNKWNGLNLLGFALMDVRNMVIKNCD